MPVGAPNVNDSHPVRIGTRFRLRMEIEEQGGLGVSTGFWLYASKNSGAYARVTTSTADLRIGQSSAYADADATTNLLPTPGTGTFVAGAGDEDAAVASVTLAALGHTEIEWTLELTSAVPGDTFDLRAYTSAGAALTTYPYTARIVAAPLSSYAPPRVIVRQAMTRSVI